MVEAIGSKVSKLVRISIGELRIGKLAVGSYRELSQPEVDFLMSEGASVRI
jgi:16S rRNA U516 pseudouridylate synthase RsuA-like enzyme